ncbi:unnamed protein product [Prorocentrum cordatum]|uniref:Uncharacterized protein n=1 Tax=Prorocentrum cordatum TaxID=2364126 RepID=A0ABN9V2X2_9DINO|nr:unnamed protein product [Polarella glacialis]
MFDTCGCFSRIAGTSASEKSEQWPMVLALLSEVREAKLELEAQRHQLQRWGQRVRTWRAAAAVAGAAQRDAGREAGAQRHLYYNPDVARARHASRAPAAPDRPDRSAVRRRLPRAPRWLQHGLRQPENVFRCALDGTRTFHMSPNGAPWPQCHRPHALRTPISAPPSHVPWPHKEPHRRPQCHRPHASPRPMPAHPSHEVGCRCASCSVEAKVQHQLGPGTGKQWRRISPLFIDMREVPMKSDVVSATEVRSLRSLRHCCSKWQRSSIPHASSSAFHCDIVDSPPPFLPCPPTAAAAAHQPSPPRPLPPGAMVVEAAPEGEGVWSVASVRLPWSCLCSLDLQVVRCIF